MEENQAMLSTVYNGGSVVLNGTASSSVVQPVNGVLPMAGHTNGLVAVNGTSACDLLPNGIVKTENNKLGQLQQHHVPGLSVPSGVDGATNQSSPAQEVKVEETGAEEDEPVIDITINNVVCSFSVGCHLDLRNIALVGSNVEYRRENGMVTMKLRRPLTTASIWSSGKITCTGSTSELQAKVAARRVARCLQKMGYKVRFRNFRIVNVLGTCTMPFAIRITQFSQKYREASYEPELHPGVTYRIVRPKATLKIFSTGSITVTAPSVSNVQNAIEHIYPMVEEFSKVRTVEEEAEAHKKCVRLADSGPDTDCDDGEEDDSDEDEFEEEDAF